MTYEDNEDDLNEPLVLADGTKIDPITGGVVSRVENKPTQYIEVPSGIELKKRYATARRRMEDLPEGGSRMNAISLVTMYTMYGLGTSDIEALTGIDADKIEYIKSSEAFMEVHNEIVKSILESDMDDVRSMIHSQSRNAVKRISWLMENSTNDKVQLEASKDILDRDGHRPADVVEHRHSVEDNELPIRVIKRDDTKELDKPIDAEFEVL